MRGDPIRTHPRTGDVEPRFIKVNCSVKIVVSLRIGGYRVLNREKKVKSGGMDRLWRNEGDRSTVSSEGG